MKKIIILLTLFISISTFAQQRMIDSTFYWYWDGDTFNVQMQNDTIWLYGTDSIYIDKLIANFDSVRINNELRIFDSIINEIKSGDTLATSEYVSQAIEDSNLWYIDGDTIKTKLVKKLNVQDTLYLETDSTIYDVIDARSGGGEGTISTVGVQEKGIPFFDSDTTKLKSDSTNFNYTDASDSLFIKNVEADTMYNDYTEIKGSNIQDRLMRFNFSDGSEASALRFGNTGNGNMFFGLNGGYKILSTAERNVSIGNYAFGEGTSGDDNLCIGYNSGGSLNTGSLNVNIGSSAGLYSTNATNCMNIGARSGERNVSGTSNVNIGTDAGRYNVGAYNINIGTVSGYGASGSSDYDNNVFIGYSAGSNNETGDDNILIGYDIDLPTASTSDYISIGNLIYGLNSSDYVGINIAAPLTSLHASFNNSSTIKTAFDGLALTGTNATANTGTSLILGHDAVDLTNNARISYIVTDQTGGSEDGYFDFSLMHAGALEQYFKAYADSLVWSIAGTRKMRLSDDGLHLADTIFLGAATSKVYDSGDDLIIETDSLEINGDGNNSISLYDALDNKDVYIGTSGNSYLKGGALGIKIDPVRVLHAYSNLVDMALRLESSTAKVGLELKDNTTTSTIFQNTGVIYLDPDGNGTGEVRIEADTTKIEHHLKVDSNLYVGGQQVNPISLGTDNQIPVVNSGGTDFEYDANYTWDGKTLKLLAIGGTNSLFIGNNAGQNTTTNFNIAIGENALQTNPTGVGNLAIGYNALNTGGANSNTAIGFGVMNSAGTSATSNTIIGYNSAPDASFNGNNNTGIGYTCFGGLTTGDRNVAIGTNAIFLTTTGSYNIGIGYKALRDNSTGSHNVMIGSSSGENTLGSENVFIGDSSGFNETGSNKLYIDNSNTATPLIYGEFDNDIVKINGTLEVANYTRSIDINSSAAGVGSTAPVATITGTFYGLAFDADAEVAYFEIEVPEDWITGEDMMLKIYWYPQNGDQIQNGETVKYDATYRSIDEGEAVDNGTAVDITGTYTQAGTSVDSELIETEITIDHDNVNQPLSVGDLVGIVFNRDVSTDTYSGDAIVVRWEIDYSSNTFPVH